MDLNDIVVFTKVVETKSFTGAADALGLPKSTVSRKLAQLEERLGVRLVQRTTRKLALTEIGEAYYERCARDRGDVAGGRAARHRHAVDAARPPPRHRLGRFLVAVSRGDRRRLPPPESRHQHRARSDRSHRRLIEEGFDLAVRFGQMPESTLIARKLYDAAADRCALRRLPRTPRHADDDRGARRARPRAVYTNVAQPDLDARRSERSDGPSSVARHVSRATTSATVVPCTTRAGGIALISEFMVDERTRRPARSCRAPRVEDAPDRSPRGLPGATKRPAAPDAVPRAPGRRALNPPPWRAKTRAWTSRVDDLRRSHEVKLIPVGFKLLRRALIFIAGRHCREIVLRGVDRMMARSSSTCRCASSSAMSSTRSLLAAVIDRRARCSRVQDDSGGRHPRRGRHRDRPRVQGSLSNFAAGVMLIMLRPYTSVNIVAIGKYLAASTRSGCSKRS